MPELPEVEAAVTELRRHVVGRTIVRARVLHDALRRRLSPARARSLTGATIMLVERRGKHQLLHLDDGRVLHAHFRMTGEWQFEPAHVELPRFARAAMDFTDGSRLVFVDTRALGTLELHAAGAALDLGLGADAADATWTAAQLGHTLASRRGPIKTALLDQKIVAGLGNIYAAEALWRAKVDPRAISRSLSVAEVRRLRKAIAAVLTRATGARYADDTANRFDVYDREGLACRRCRTAIEKIVQAGRSTYFCPVCQSGR